MKMYVKNCGILMLPQMDNKLQFNQYIKSDNMAYVMLTIDIQLKK